MKQRNIHICATVLCVVLVISSCNFFSSQISINNITEELSASLLEEYGLNLTNSSQIISGQIDVSAQDKNIQIIFHIPENDLAKCLDNQWIIEEVNGPDINGESSVKTYYRPAQENKYCREAFLYHTESDKNGEIAVLFDGANPSTDWLD